MATSVEAGATPPVSPRESTRDAPTSVSSLNRTIKGFIDGWGTVWVEGEITSWNPRGGAIFARMKDLADDAQISLRIWSSVRSRLPATLAVGDHVVACVKADFYPKTGDLGFQVSAMRHVGLGEQLERLERLRQQLRSEGLFDPARKRPLPFLPRAIGLVTGEHSDAEKDVLRNAELRWPQVDIRVRHAAVQGDRCVPDVMGALRALESDSEVEVIIVARGGGDPQTLLGFSDERLIRLVAELNTPVVSAIGHENDHPLLDDVADMRASTPTDAAKRVVPDVSEQRMLVADLRQRAKRRLATRVAHDLDSLASIRSRPVLRQPERMIEERALAVQMSVDRGRDALDRRLGQSARALGELRATLRAISPQATLARGYAIALTERGEAIRHASDAPAGAAMLLRLADGAVGAESLGPIDTTNHATPQDPRIG